MSTEWSAERKLEFVLREYWLLRNGKARAMRCPYCSTGNTMKRNHPGRSLCCVTFAKAFKAIMDRQDRIEAGMRERIVERLLAN
jgi:hypothetical protein